MDFFDIWILLDSNLPDFFFCLALNFEKDIFLWNFFQIFCRISNAILDYFQENLSETQEIW